MPTSQFFQLASPAFHDGGALPAAYACDGVVAPLQWFNVPAGTVSFTVTLTDLAGGLVWIASNIPANTTSLPTGHAQVRFVRGGCPSGQRRYQFTVQALGTHSPISSTGGASIVSVTRTVITPGAMRGGDGGGGGPVLATSTLTADLTVP